MARRVCFCLVLFSLIAAWRSRAQTSGQAAEVRDQQALLLLSQCLKAGGGEDAFAKIKDFSATGRITHFWGGREVEAGATMKGRSSEEFRMDSSLREGTRSIVVAKNSGKISEQGGRSRELPYHNRLNLGALNLPFIAILEALRDPSTSVRMLGQVSLDGRSVYQIRTQRSFASQGDKDGILSHLSIKDFFIDTISFLPVSTRWMTHPSDDYRQEFSQQMTFGDFRALEGVLVPFTVSESISGQKTWVFRADQVKLNQGLLEDAFKP
jgi:hypothetical protein